LENGFGKLLWKCSWNTPLETPLENGLGKQHLKTAMGNSIGKQ
jgi:hypothetical protein